MDKKILLSGVAALMMSSALTAPSASAAIDVSMSGEAKLTATFNDACSDSDVDLSTSSDATADNVTSLSAHTACSGNDSDDMPVWATTSKLEFGASGTLANGLGVSVDLGAGAAGGAGSEIALSGAFGSIAWKDGGDSAVKMALPNGDGALTVSSRDDLGGHSLATSGTAGYVVAFTAPSVGGMDLFVTYAPSSANSAVNDDAYLDTIAIGAKMSAGDITIGAGWESASYNSNAGTAAGCIASTAAIDVDGTDGALVNLAATADALLGGDLCGDQSLMGIGAEMALADMTINAGYTKLDTDEADKTTYNVGLSTSVGEYSLGLDYVNSSKSYILASTTSHDQTAIGASLGTSLGDGVDLTLGFTSSSVDVADTGAHSNYNAEVELKITY
jgi:hypothetical protein